MLITDSALGKMADFLQVLKSETEKQKDELGDIVIGIHTSDDPIRLTMELTDGVFARVWFLDDLKIEYYWKHERVRPMTTNKIEYAVSSVLNFFYVAERRRQDKCFLLTIVDSNTLRIEVGDTFACFRRNDTDIYKLAEFIEKIIKTCNIWKTFDPIYFSTDKEADNVSINSEN